MKHKFIFYFVFGLILTACSNAPAYTDMISPTKDAYCTHGNITHNIPPEIIETTDINDTLQTPQMDNDGQPSEDNWAVTIMHMSNEMELYAFWFMTPFMDGLAVYVDEFMLEKNNFLQTFNAYTRIGEPSENDLSWVVFSANTDLYDFQFFT
ncbi:MAG: hypothetical protein FWC89_03535, partial [Defluviitaleaceae bacterium]|nr:hypothetical protein [Defluviitaleaceae bacterium]